MADSKKTKQQQQKNHQTNQTKNPLNTKAPSKKTARISLITKICNSVKFINTKPAFFANQAISHVLQIKSYMNKISKKLMIGPKRMLKIMENMML